VHYLIAGNDIAGALPEGCSIVADGEMVSFERPWTFGTPLLARIGDATPLEAVKARAAGTVSAFAVEGFAEPGPGQVVIIAAHMMRDAKAFRPYAEAVPGVIARFGCRYLARGGNVTPIAGTFVPDRVVLMEFATADDAVAFYFSEAYAPLLKIRLATTEPRFVMLARSGALPAGPRRIVAEKLRAG
jgi:uncharacterized protein (DUF1330 family)